MSSTKHRTSDVFGVSRDVPLNYVERKTVDDRFIANLAVDKHVIVYGSSKQGKTCLRKHCLSEHDFILVQCQNGWGLEKLAEAILKEAGYKVEVTTEKTVEQRFKLRAVVSAKLRALGFGEAGSEVQSSSESAQEVRKTLRPIEVDPEDPNDLVSALSQIEFSKFIVLEDFHYLPQETQEKYAFFLKTIHERSRICFVIVAVWREENRLILFNGDLSGRVISVDADAWKSHELYEVISKGEQLLNVSFPIDFKSKVADVSLGSVYIVQEACRRVCEDNQIINSQDQNYQLILKKPIEEYIADVVRESGPRYLAFLNNFSGGFQDTALEMYKWILYPILKSSIVDLEAGIKYRYIRETLESVHPKGHELNPGNVTQALQSIPALQAKKNVKPFVLDYDQSNLRLSVVDKGFLIWLSTQDIDELLERHGINVSANLVRSLP